MFLYIFGIERLFYFQTRKGKKQKPRYSGANSSTPSVFVVFKFNFWNTMETLFLPILIGGVHHSGFAFKTKYNTVPPTSKIDNSIPIIPKNFQNFGTTFFSTSTG